MPNTTLTVESTVKASPQRVWDFWSKPEHIVNWAFAGDDWEATAAENDLRPGGKFKTVMAAKNKSSGFDFSGTYTDVQPLRLIEYDMDDGRYVKIDFEPVDEGVRIIQTFEPETINPLEMQRSGWQTILDNFKKYVEAQS